MMVSEEAIQLREGTTDVAVRRENVLRVTLLEKSHRLRNILIFGGAGCGVGAGIGAAAVSNDGIVPGKPIAAAFGGVIGLLGGIGVGAAWAALPAVYRGSSPSSPPLPHAACVCALRSFPSPLSKFFPLPRRSPPTACFTSASSN